MTPRPIRPFSFYETHAFTRDWDELGLSDEYLMVLQAAILRDPEANPLIRAAGGLRKMRYAPRHWGKGKRGALRICYVFFGEADIVLLVACYTKNEQSDISAAHKKAYRRLIQETKKELSSKDRPAKSGPRP